MFEVPSLSMLTDLYQLTMAYGYWKLGIADKGSCFHLFYRKAPYGGAFAVAAGLESILEACTGFRFTEGDLTYLATLKDAAGGRLLPDDFLDYLSDLTLTCDLDAMPEGTLTFPLEPVLRVEGPLLQAQLLETLLLNLTNFPTLIATKAARLRLAAGKDQVMDFGLRRAQGVDGGMTATRASFVGGCDSTSNVAAGQFFGIPIRGTHAHSWVMAFPTEEASFDAYAEVMPDNCILLVDTYETLEGVKKAAKVGLQLKKRGKRLLGIRLDSGDLLSLSLESRKILDAAGLTDSAIVASNELDEYQVADLKAGGSPISVWGVGTRLVTGHPQAALGGVYKLAAVEEAGEWVYKAKRSDDPQKSTPPGRMQIRRYYDGERPVGDVIYAIDKGIDSSCTADSASLGEHPFSGEHRDLLVPVLRKGRSVYTPPSLTEMRELTLSQLETFPVNVLKLDDPEPYFVGYEKGHYQILQELTR